MIIIYESYLFYDKFLEAFVAMPSSLPVPSPITGVDDVGSDDDDGDDDTGSNYTPEMSQLNQDFYRRYKLVAILTYYGCR